MVLGIDSFRENLKIIQSITQSLVEQLATFC